MVRVILLMQTHRSYALHFVRRMMRRYCSFLSPRMPSCQLSSVISAPSSETSKAKRHIRLTQSRSWLNKPVHFPNSSPTESKTTRYFHILYLNEFTLMKSMDTGDEYSWMMRIYRHCSLCRYWDLWTRKIQYIKPRGEWFCRILGIRIFWMEDSLKGLGDRILA